MIQPAVADVIGPAIAANNPDRTAHQMIDNRQQMSRRRIVLHRQKPGLQRGDPLSLGANFGLSDLRRLDDVLDQPFVDLSA